MFDLLSMLSESSVSLLKKVPSVPGKFVEEVSGVGGLAGESDGGGGAGSGFSRLSCTLRFRACWDGGCGIEAEVAGSGVGSRFRIWAASLDGARPKVKDSSRMGIALLSPR